MNTHFTRALIAFGNENYAAAAEAAHLAAKEQPESLVYTAAATYLNRVCTDGKAGVYVTGEAFAAFIRGGGNLPLYAKLSTALRNVYTTYNQVSLLDLGVGDGMALLPALSPQVTSLNLVEPSAPMLAQVCAALDARGIAYTAINSDFQTFSDQGGCWDLGQATFSLQALTPAERLEALAWLRSRCIRVLIAEFDVPEFADLYAPERMAHFT
ncbi:MAG: class I SAM-dependent methyltransferase, partial [Oscillochloris sp.]|nr:class I SAM-dependent methyltransferase [Oscillochloris sp.]